MNKTHSTNNEIDVGLAVLCAVTPRQQTMTFNDIADVCGCSRQFIQKIQSRAMNKIRKNTLAISLMSELK